MKYILCSEFLSAVHLMVCGMSFASKNIHLSELNGRFIAPVFTPLIFPLASTVIIFI